MNQFFSKIWIIVIVLVFLTGGFLAWQYFKVPEVKTQIRNLEIIPSQKTEQGIVYQEGAKAIVTGKDLAKVEFRQRGGGQIYTSPEGGLVGIGIKTEIQERKEQWELLLPSNRLMVELCALGFDGNGEKVGEVCLFNVLGEIKKDETTNWKAYRNEEYGFEFKYPSGLVADTSSQGIPFFGNEKTLIFLIGRDNVINFSFRVSVFKGSLELLKNSINNYKEQLRQTYIQLGKKEPQFSESTITIGGKSGFIFVHKNNLNAEFFYTPLDNQNVLLIGKAGNGNYESISNEILSTFRFLN